MKWEVKEGRREGGEGLKSKWNEEEEKGRMN